MLNRSRNRIAKIRCKECGGYFKSIFPSHLNNAHNMTLPQYQEKYPGAPYQTLELANKRSESATKINTGRKLSKETKDQISESLRNSPKVARGVDCHLYKDGKGGTPYLSTWSRTKLQIMERDGYSCQGKDCRKKQPVLNVHHIDENPQNDNPENLITLCSSCHRRAHKNSLTEEARGKRKVWHPIGERDTLGRIKKKKEK